MIFVVKWNQNFNFHTSTNKFGYYYNINTFQQLHLWQFDMEPRQLSMCVWSSPFLYTSWCLGHPSIQDYGPFPRKYAKYKCWITLESFRLHFRIVAFIDTCTSKSLKYFLKTHHLHLVIESGYWLRIYFQFTGAIPARTKQNEFTILVFSSYISQWKWGFLCLEYYWDRRYQKAAVWAKLT